MRKCSIRMLCAALPTLVALQGRAQDPPPAITTDTVEYCDHLQHMVADRASRLAEVRRLLNDGHRMCDHGEIRGGIARLRKALMLTRPHPAPS